MRSAEPLSFRALHPGMGEAVAQRTILRNDRVFNAASCSYIDDWETWGDVAHRVALGNSLLCDSAPKGQEEYRFLQKHLAKATTLMSGRHLQHGDEEQPSRPLEVFTNCATSATSFALFLLLLSGSGVGRCYDDDLILIDWDNAPTLRCVLDDKHPDFDVSAHESVRDAIHKYGLESRSVMWFRVPDSREGWAQAVEVWENLAFEKIHKDKMLIIDFSLVRPRGAPIRGMQNRPASGPVTLMNAFMKAASLKGSGLSPWKQAMYVDHYFAECVLVGGARRAARMSTKFWRDPGIIDFICIKRPIEFEGKDVEEVIAFRRANPQTYGFLWSSNNSVTVDREFWDLLDLRKKDDGYSSPDAKHARKVWREVVRCNYGDGTGEPGVINVDKLVRNDEGWESLNGDWIGSERYRVREETEVLLAKLCRAAKRKKYNMITNPCGEVCLTVLGGYCVIADLVPFHASTLDEAEEAFRAVTRALIRVNQMDSLYRRETARTNRIGVSITGIHEFAWKFFRCGFRDLINPDFESWDDDSYVVESVLGSPWKSPQPRRAEVRAAAFWRTLERFNGAVKDEATKYSKELGVPVPHTLTTVKPSGTVSKLFGLTEGWHLPSMREFMRWVQFRSDDPLVRKYSLSGYPTRELKTYQGTTIVGFPTAPVITTLGMGDKLVLASEATPEEQYRWLQLGEKFWIVGKGEDRGAQISYTLKYDPERVTLEEFEEMVRRHQRNVRACSVMPASDATSHEYQPEQPVTKVEYEAICHKIDEVLAEDVDKAHVDCSTGSCPVDFREKEVA